MLRNDRARETALNIDGALPYRSIRQPLSHNYTSASSRMMHHMNMHDYILQALRPNNIYSKTVQRAQNSRDEPSNLSTLFKSFSMNLVLQFASHNGIMSL